MVMSKCERCDRTYTEDESKERPLVAHVGKLVAGVVRAERVMHRCLCGSLFHRDLLAEAKEAADVAAQ